MCENRGGVRAGTRRFFGSWSRGLHEHLPAEMPDEDLVNALAQYLEFEPIEKLALLQQPGAVARCRSVQPMTEPTCLTLMVPPALAAWAFAFLAMAPR